jgi:uncharacterized protein (DUF2252 family)
MDVVKTIQAFNAGRDPERLAMKYAKLRASSFGFLRGTCHLFQQRLPDSGVLKSAPPAWICGDLHLENFGSYKAANGLVYFDINDFDEAYMAPASWDMARLLTALWLANEAWRLPAATMRELGAATLAAYADALAEGKAYWVERDTAEGLVRDLLDSRRLRKRPQFLARRTTLKKNGQRKLITDGTHALPASRTQHALVADFMAELAQDQPDPEFFRVLDVARRIAGTGSLGAPRYVVLVEGKGSPDGNYLLDLKQALPSALAPHVRKKPKQPRWPSEAHRVVGLQRRLQAVNMLFLQPVELDGQAWILRALLPSEDRVAMQCITPKTLLPVLQTMGRLAAWSQLRGSGHQGAANADELMAFGARRGWRAKLLAQAEDCAAQVQADAKLFNKAYDQDKGKSLLAGSSLSA